MSKTTELVTFRLKENARNLNRQLHVSYEDEDLSLIVPLGDIPFKLLKSALRVKDILITEITFF
jgi:hypothetical protein